MRRERVRSSSVVSVGYDRKLRVLEIEYEGGHAYRYFDVPLKIHTELMAVASKGIYVNAVIKPRFRYAAVPDEKRDRRD